MDYYDSSKFYSSFSSDDKIRLYSVFCGGQYYNIQIDERQTVKENIIRLISGTFSGLKDFVETYLKTELEGLIMLILFLILSQIVHFIIQIFFLNHKLKRQQL